MINEKFFLKIPVNFQNKCKIYAPSVNEVLENENFNLYRKILTMSQEEIEDIYVEKKIEENPLSPIEYMLSAAYQNPNVLKITKDAFAFFIHEEVSFLFDQKIIVIGDIKKTLQKIKDVNELRMIKEEDFFDFQNLIREALGEKPVEPPNPNEDPRVKRIKAKGRYRERIKAKKGLGLNFSSTLASICCMNFGLNPLNIGEISYASLSTLIKYYQEKEKYEIDIQSLLAGAKTKPKYWIRNIDD